jgi:hypothetical protein
MNRRPPLNEAPDKCMYPICTCYGEGTPYLCDQEICQWPACECPAPKPDSWEKCRPEQRSK